MTDYNGGPAFPSGAVSIGDGDTIAYSPGISARDWFAGQPDITGSLAVMCREACEALCGPAPDASDALALFKWQVKVQAALRYIAADAMIEASK